MTTMGCLSVSLIVTGLWMAFFLILNETGININVRTTPRAGTKRRPALLWAGTVARSGNVIVNHDMALYCKGSGLRPGQRVTVTVYSD